MAMFEGEQNGPVPDDLRWWQSEDDDDLARRVFAAARNIIVNNVDREELLWRNVRMYSGQTRESYWGDAGEYPLASAGTAPQRVNRNVVASITDTLTATLSANPIKSTVLASGGDYARTRKRSKTAEKYIDGVKYNNKFEMLAPLVLKTALVCDIGMVKVFEDEETPGSIKIEHVFPAELVVDELDGMHKAPRQIMQRKMVSREVLKEKYPDAADEIDGANTLGTGLSQTSLADKIEVFEAWHLPSGPDADDGLHVICIDKAVLVKEPWRMHRFPFAFLRPDLSMFGFYGRGVASDLVGIQYEINSLSANKQQALKVASNVMVMIPTGSHVNKSHIINGVGVMVEYTGDKPPTWYTPNPVSSQANTEIMDLITWSYQRWGVSQLTAQSQKPAGLDSGEALRTYANIESVRHNPLGKAYQQFHLDVGELILYTARMIDQNHEEEHKAALKADKAHKRKQLTVRVPDEKRIQEISWEDADPGDGFVVKLYATNLFAESPADRLAQLGDLVSKGAIDMDTFLSVNDFPDLENLNKIRNAPRANIEKQLDDIILDGKYRSPEPFQNLQLGLQLFQAALLTAEDEGVDATRLGMLQRWMGEAKTMLSPPPPPAPAPGAGPMQPMPNPMLPPPPGAVPPPGVAAQPLAAPMPAPTPNPMPNPMPQ